MCSSSLQKDGIPQEETFCKILFILFLPTYSKRKGNWNRGSFWTQHECRACNCRVTFSLNLSLSYSSSRPFETVLPMQKRPRYFRVTTFPANTASKLIKMPMLFSFSSLNSFKGKKKKKADNSPARGKKESQTNWQKNHGLNVIITTSFKLCIPFIGPLFSICSFFPCSMLMANHPFTSRF